MYYIKQTYKVEKGERMKIIKISAEHQYKFVRNTTNIIINKYKLLQHIITQKSIKC